MNPNKCLNCNKDLRFQRIDAKFCNDGCRNAHWYKQKLRAVEDKTTGGN